MFQLIGHAFNLVQVSNCMNVNAYENCYKPEVECDQVSPVEV